MVWYFWIHCQILFSLFANNLFLKGKCTRDFKIDIKEQLKEIYENTKATSTFEQRLLDHLDPNTMPLNRAKAIKYFEEPTSKPIDSYTKFVLVITGSGSVYTSQSQSKSLKKFGYFDYSESKILIRSRLIENHHGFINGWLIRQTHNDFLKKMKKEEVLAYSTNTDQSIGSMQALLDGVNKNFRNFNLKVMKIYKNSFVKKSGSKLWRLRQIRDYKLWQMKIEKMSEGKFEVLLL